MREGFEKRFNKGDVVYWHRQIGHKHFVEYGIVDEQFSATVCIDLLKYKERRLVNGIPIDEFPSCTRYKKLPKGWTYDTHLYEESYQPWTDEEIKILNKNKLSNPENIKKLYELGYLVKSSQIFTGYIESEVNKEGYRIKKTYPRYKQIIHSIGVPSNKVYFTYAEAKKEVDEYLAELKRQSELSDYDWSVEEIDKVLNRWSGLYNISEDVKNDYRKWLLNLDNIEDLVIKINSGDIQWKYDKNKKWRNIEL